MKPLLLGVMLSFLFPVGASAQSDKPGGGGDFVRCKIPGSRKFKNYLLDVYELELQGKKIDFGPSTLTHVGKIRVAVESLSKIDPARAQRWGREAEQILEDLQTFESKGHYPNRLATFSDQNRPLDPIHDSGDTVQYPECKPRQQLVRQKENFTRLNEQFGHSPVYTFDRNLWNRLDSDNQVATLFHEVIYREFRRYGAEISVAAREFNRFVITRELETWSHKRYLDLLSQNRIPQFYLQTDLGPVEVYPTNLMGGRWGAKFDSQGAIRFVFTPQGLVPSVMSQIRLPIEISEIAGVFIDEDRKISGFVGEVRVAVDFVENRIEATTTGSKPIETGGNTLTFYLVKLKPSGGVSLYNHKKEALELSASGVILNYFPIPEIVDLLTFFLEH